MLPELSSYNAYLGKLRQERTPVVVYLRNGIKLEGRVGGFDASVMLLHGMASMMVYRHAVATILPAVSSEEAEIVTTVRCNWGKVVLSGAATAST